MQEYRALLLTAAMTGAAACSQQMPPTDSAQPASSTGERIYDGSCAACHRADGQGIPGVYPSLAGSPVVAGDPEALAAWVIKGQRPATMPPAGRYPTKMLQFGWLKDQDAAALLTFVRSHFGNSAPAVDAATVARASGT
jgi:mono/diheme cytochrome c family protein